jgi:hypothetical protein
MRTIQHNIFNIFNIFHNLESSKRLFYADIQLIRNNI